MFLSSCKFMLLWLAAVSSFCWESLWSLTRVWAYSFTAVFWVWSCIICAVSISSLLTVLRRSAARLLALAAECEGCDAAWGLDWARQNGTASARMPPTSQVDEVVPMRTGASGTKQRFGLYDARKRSTACWAAKNGSGAGWMDIHATSPSQEPRGSPAASTSKTETRLGTKVASRY